MSLPIDTLLPRLCQALARQTRALLIAAPGAGKTTRVPLALLDEPWCVPGRLLLLEPRRVAARLAARFMAESLGEALGDTVGYRVRGESRVGPHTRLEVVTQGVLTRMLQDDPMLEGVSGIVFDEFHERSLDADLGLALALDVQEGLREDLRLLVMSATLNVGALRRVLGDETALLESEGRQFPITTHYRATPARGKPERHQAAVVREALGTSRGDILVFLPGQREIRRLAQELATLTDVRVLPLHGQLTLAQQQQALRRDEQGHRRVVLSTAIAESSVTVDGVEVVIDSGWERVPRFQPRSGLTRLETHRLNRASAEQRRGRAGRQGPGLCFRLWAEEQPLPSQATPEMLQADLAPLAFELSRWGIADPAQIKWVDMPPEAALASGRALLRQLGLLDEAHHLTVLGHACVRWPMHPRLAVMFERAEALSARPLACWLVALLERRDAIAELDLTRRLSALPTGRSQGSDRAWYTDARRWARRAGCSLTVDDLTPLGALLAIAYPDRIAGRIEVGRFKLSGGGQALLDVRQNLAHQDYLVVTELDGEAQGARIFRAAPVELATLLALYPQARDWQQRFDWDDESGRLQGEEVRGLGELVFERRAVQHVPKEALRQALLDALKRRGWLELGQDAVQLRARVALLEREQGDAWPDWSDAALMSDLEVWLGPYIDDARRLDDIDRLPLASVLLDRLDWPQRQRLERLAPTHIQVPSGSRVRIDYSVYPPVLAVKLQELFGVGQTPAIVEGRVVLMLHLLSPARRPIQVTRDLANFWRTTYFEVRKDLKGRYPKHPWPDDPLAAIPTARTRSR
ncbi:ATP-dependent helicase HrpB [Modicisalibacter muralis]|uniref:ATP-dependent helicase HrpB n=1 Tax=Modicisalibacter muralis TaxID=119000 RepID=A0A1G9G3A5_9GAMM|nr:ATP-dependent helicase HrpB [Halomonas muralis]SDK95116.1 ATP-dependent helicase HrpB [Halomonas muralis]